LVADERDPISTHSETDIDAIKMVNASFRWHTSRSKDGNQSTVKPPLNQKAEKEDAQNEPNNSEMSPNGPTLKNLTFTIPRGSLTAVVGTVGSGKSSLLSAITGDISRSEPNTAADTFSLHPSIPRLGISLCLQQPWLMSSSLQNNICFGKEVDDKKLMKVLEVCGLSKDLEAMENGLDTEIGEKVSTILFF
jgi:ABC-type multidrug transport system fused ATPase/permease subunit